MTETLPPQGPARHLAAGVLVVFAVFVVLGGLATRAGALLGWPRAPGLLEHCAWAATGVSALWLLRRRPATLAVAVSLFGAILAHSYVHLYWPSLARGVPRQDWLLMDQVSANYSFDAAKIYLKNAFRPLVCGLAAADAYCLAGRGPRRLVGLAVGLVVLAQVGVVAIQGWVKLQFLAAGSGTAVGADRPPGLFEDSGASTVGLGAVASALFYLGVFGARTIRQRALWLSLFVVTLIAGAHMGGRVFFASIIGATALGIVVAARRAVGRRHLGRALPWVLVAGILAAVVWVIPRTPLQQMLPGLSRLVDPDGASLLERLNRSVTMIDPVRAVHIKTMLFAWLDHPWGGTGLGTFYANYFQYLTRALASGGQTFADPPASFYFMLLSELGLAGAVLLVVLVAQLIFGFRRAASPWNAAATGALAAVLVSFAIGVHLIFVSFGALLAVVTFGLALGETGRWPWRWPLWASAGWLAVIAAWLALTPPRPPAFRWLERGKPQVPLSLIVPISPRGHQGLWLSSGGELLYRGKPVSLFVEMPPEFYPLTVKVELHGPEGQSLAERTETIAPPNREQPWRLLTETFDEAAVTAACGGEPTPERFCSYRLETSPVWKWDGQRVGAFVVDPQ